MTTYYKKLNSRSTQSVPKKRAQKLGLKVCSLKYTPYFFIVVLHIWIWVCIYVSENFLRCFLRNVQGFTFVTSPLENRWRDRCMRSDVQKFLQHDHTQHSRNSLCMDFCNNDYFVGSNVLFLFLIHWRICLEGQFLIPLFAYFLIVLINFYSPQVNVCSNISF